MGRKRKKELGISTLSNESTYQFFYSKLTELAISMFEWKGLPPSVDQRFLELCLFGDGMAVFFKDEVLDFLTLQVLISGQLDVYRVPIDRTAYAYNGYNKTLTKDDSVIIFNNYLRTNTVLEIEQFAWRLYKVQKAIDLNINAQKTPLFISTTENQKYTMEKMYESYDGDKPLIIADKSINEKGFNVFKTDAPFLADKLQMLKNQIWNEAMTFLGISNVSMEKKERLVTDEVSRSMGSTIASRYSRLEMRRQACDQINRLFNLNVSVDCREDFQLLMERESIVEGGEEIEQVHN